MSRYYLQLRNHASEMLDPDGTECFDTGSLRNVVLVNARDIIAGDVKNGVLDLSFRIDAEDASGVLVHSLPFADAIVIASISCVTAPPVALGAAQADTILKIPSDILDH